MLVGDYLSPHYDHIQDFFQGQFRGIPVTSVVGVRDDFEGGDFVFWEEHTVNIKRGVLVFPALYLFPHEVTQLQRLDILGYNGLYGPDTTKRHVGGVPTF